MMLTHEKVRDLIGCTLVDTNTDKIGKIGQVYLDDRTGEPAWATVNTGLFGKNESFVPLSGATLTGDNLRVPFDKGKVKEAPNIDVEHGHLDATEEQQLYGYYGIEYRPGAGPESAASRASDPRLRRFETSNR